MSKATLYQGNKTIKVVEKDTQPLKPEEVRLEVGYCGICETDRDAAADMKVSANTLVLSWMREQGMIPLITGSTLEQIKENIASLDCSLNKEISDKIAGLYYPHRE